jgi:VIT1/CCC1 family predicted Fe2+/Mn2+ transporter
MTARRAVVYFSPVAATMDEERHLQPVHTPDISRRAVVIAIATLIGHLIPLLPFVWLPRTTALVTAIVLSRPP